jgi:hypothetical protein
MRDISRSMVARRHVHQISHKEERTVPCRHNQTSFSSSPAKEETAKSNVQHLESALSPGSQQIRNRIRPALNTLGAVALAVVCAARMANSEGLTVASSHTGVQAQPSPRAVFKADFIDDIIDIINGGGDDDEDEPTDPQPRP